MSGLPNLSWSVCTLGDASDVVTKGTTPTTAGFPYLPEGVPFVKVENINEYGVDLNSVTQFISDEAHMALVRSQLQEGDILFSIAGTIGKTALVKKEYLPCNTNQAVAIIRGSNKVFQPTFLRYQLKHAARQIEKANARGGAMNNISLGDLKNVELALPPFPEQQRIADQLDATLARVDACRARLARVAPILKRFRQSVLAAATSGQLTADWREQQGYSHAGNDNNDLQGNTHVGRVSEASPDNPNPSENASGSWPKVKSSRLHALPIGWEMMSPEELRSSDKHSLGIGPFGSSLMVKDYQDEGEPLVFVREIRARTFGDEKTKFISKEKFDELSAHVVSGGDLLITKMGDPPGDVAIYPFGMPDAVITSDCIKLRVDGGKALTAYVYYTMQSDGFRSLVKDISAGVAQQKVSLTKFREIRFPIAPIEEQTEIVRRVETLFAFADRLEARLASATAAAERLTPSLLAKAFRGELVPQDPNDEPASELLKRLAAQREAMPKAKRSRKGTA